MKKHPRSALFFFVLFGCAAFATLVLAHGILANPVADDFSNAMQVQEAGGLFAFVKSLYFRWTGRVFSNALLWVAFQRPAGFQLSSFVLAVLQLAAAPLLLGMFSGVSRTELHQWWKAERSALLFVGWVSSVALWFAWDPFLAQCVFWPTGGLVYLAPWIAVLVWFWRATGEPAAHTAWGWMALLAISLLLGTGHEQLSAALLLAGAPVWWGDLRRGICRRSWTATEKLRLLMAVAFGTGTLFALLAPGNFARATRSPSVFPKEALPIARAVRDVIRSFLPYFIPGAVYGFVTGLIAGALRGEKSKSKPRIGGGTAFLAMWGALVPLMSVPGFASLRTFFIPTAFAFAAFARLGAGGGWLAGVRASLRRHAAVVQIGGAVLLIVALSITFAQPLSHAVLLKRELQARTAAIAVQASLQPRPSVLTLSALRTPAPRWVHTDDLTTDPNKQWINEAVAKYYGFSEARLAP